MFYINNEISAHNIQSYLDKVDLDQLIQDSNEFIRLFHEEKQKQNELQLLHKQLYLYAESINSSYIELKRKNNQLKDAYMDTINRLIIASRYKDDETGAHIVRMSKYCGAIAQNMNLKQEEIDNLSYASSLHDVGKIGIPDNILLKPGRLTKEEFEIMKTHTIIGANILRNSSSDILQMAYQIAVSHHEKWNGTGYPYQLKADNIPLYGRIVAICDVFDALTTKRPYKEAFSIEYAVDIIKKEREQHFDPEITDLFLQSIEQIICIKEQKIPPHCRIDQNNQIPYLEQSSINKG